MVFYPKIEKYDVEQCIEKLIFFKNKNNAIVKIDISKIKAKRLCKFHKVNSVLFKKKGIQILQP